MRLALLGFVASSAWITGCSGAHGASDGSGGGAGSGLLAGSGGDATTQPTTSSGAGTGGATSSASTGSSSSGAGGSSFHCAADQGAFDQYAASIAKQLEANGVVGGAISIVCGGDTVYAKGLGAVEKGGAPVDEHTRFQLASLTKTFTATLAARLADKGTLTLDDAVTKWVPYVNTSAPYGAGFTLSQLLAHASGYPAGLDTANYDDLEGSFQQNAGVKLWAPPGAVFNYSNDGFSLAGLALQKAAGKPFGGLVEAEVFAPTGMVDARMDAHKVLSEGHYAVGYSTYDGSVSHPTDSYLATPYYGPMGGAWASVSDLATFAKVLIHGAPGFLSAASFKAMTTPHTATTWGSSQYGQGLILDDFSGTALWRHDGSVGGFLSSLVVVPSRGFAIAVLVNSDGFLPDVYDSVTKFTGSGLPPATIDGSFNPASEADHLGSYQSADLGAITVQKSGSDMQITIAGQTQTMVPEWKDTYAITYQSYPLDVTFFREGGAVKYVVTAYGVGEKM